MRGFETVTLRWQGGEYAIPPERQLRLIADLEDILATPGTPAVLALTSKNTPNYARLSEAYGAALRFAGAEVEDAEIYLHLQDLLSEGDPSAAILVQREVIGLLAIMSPPAHRKITTPKETAPEKSNRGETRAASSA